ncbi:MAG: hypothetical protein AAGC45_01805 [Bacteroidota bacterium]
MTLQIIAQSENPTIEKLVKDYKGYFKTDRKSVHLHLNKTVFLTGENIWFSAYIFNHSQNLPSREKEYIYIDLIDSEGKVLVQKTILFGNGKGNGELFLANSIRSGLYFLQAYTASMQNFEEDDSTKYPVLINNYSTNDFTNYDYKKETGRPIVQIAPEGGNLLAGVFTKCTVRSINSLGTALVPDSAIVLENHVKHITKIKLDSNGFSTFSIIPDLGKKYDLQLFKDGRIISKPLPTVQESGVTFSVARNPYKNELAVQVYDTRTLKEGESNGLYFIIHKDQNIVDVPIGKFATKEKFEFKISYDLLLEGINEFTVVDSYGKIHASRLFFHRSELSPKKFAIDNRDRKSDSIELSVKLLNNSIGANQNLSVSILPGETRSQRFRKKALFALQLEPYFPSPEWRYLWCKEIDSFKDLDFMDQITLLAKSKYDWKTILNKNLSIPESNYYAGAIEGVVEPRNISTKPKVVLLYSKTNELLMNADVVDGKFSFRELVLEKGSILNLSLIGTDGKPHKANFSYVIKPVIENFRHRFSTADIHKSEEFNEELSQIYRISSETQQLDEVTVTAEKLKYQRFFPSYFGIKVDSTIGMNTLKDFVRKLGFYPILVNPKGRDRRAGTLQMATRSIRCGTIFPAIIFNGVYDEYFSPYEDIRMEYIDEVYWDRPGIGACKALLVVFTNEKYLIRPKPDSQITSKEIIIARGFDNPQPFKRPQYFETDNTSFKHFGVLGWESSLPGFNDDMLKFKIPVENEEKIMVVIEGYSDSGKIISENHLIALNKP